jgi:hypothetical protein
MEPVSSIAAVASRIAQSATRPSHVISFIAVVLVLFQMLVVWRLLP